MTPKIAAAYAAGYRKFMIHRPFGEAQSGQSMAFDSYLQLASEPLNQEFPIWLQSVLDRFLDIRIIAYVGSSRITSSMNELLANDEINAWYEHATQSIDPLLGSMQGNDRVDIVFDYASTYSESMIHWQFIDMIHEEFSLVGKNVFIESIPFSENTFQHDVGSFAVESSWVNLLNENNRYFSPGKTVRWLNRAAYFNSELWREEGGFNNFIADCKSFQTIPAIDYTLIDWSETDQNNVVHISE